MFMVSKIFLFLFIFLNKTLIILFDKNALN